MTRDHLENLLVDWQVQLGLSDYDVSIDWDTPCDDSEALAEVACIADTYNRAEISIGKDWKTWDDERAEYVIIHELLHVVLRDTQHEILRCIEPNVSEAHFKTLEEVHTTNYERAVDHIARCFQHCERQLEHEKEWRQLKEGAADA